MSSLDLMTSFLLPPPPPPPPPPTPPPPHPPKKKEGDKEWKIEAQKTGDKNKQTKPTNQ